MIFLFKILLTKDIHYMKKRDHNIKYAKEWFKIGDDELGYAKAAFDDFDDFYSQMCVQAHQAVEKYLKGVLVYHNIRYPLTHDLVVLLRKCSKIEKRFEKFLNDCKIISNYYTDLRYPVHYLILDKNNAQHAIESAQRIRNFIKKWIST